LIIGEKVPVRNDSSSISFGPPIMRSTLPERTVESDPSLPVLPDVNSSNDRPVSPRMTPSALQFYTPGISPVRKEPSPAVENRTEVVTPLEISPPAIIPSMMLPFEMQERAPRYSPWERRSFTVPSRDDLGENLENALPPPPRLL
jgi:hypothetical protein